jgi:hypothetical protein
MKKFLMCAALLAFASHSMAADALPDCTGFSDVKSKSRTLNEMSTLMVTLLTLEKQGEANFTPNYPVPASQCALEHYTAAGAPVTPVYSPFEKGAGMALLYRFVVEGVEPREIVVVYDGLASIMAKKTVFLVIEKRNGDVSFYEMYRDQPAYAVLKPLVTSILDGSAKALATVRWPPGAKEPVIDAIDSKRLK